MTIASLPMARSGTVAANTGAAGTAPEDRPTGADVWGHGNDEL